MTRTDREGISLHRKKRLDIVVEAPVLDRLLRRLDELEATGYTVVPAQGGRGATGIWRRDGMVGDAGRMVLVICVTDSDRVDSLLDVVGAIVARHSGIVTVSDVDVLRAERF